jgi:hypothetical protein
VVSAHEHASASAAFAEQHLCSMMQRGSIPIKMDMVESDQHFMGTQWSVIAGK